MNKQSQEVLILNKLMSRIHKGFTQAADDIYGEGYLSKEERIKLSNIIGDCLQTFEDQVKKELPQLLDKKIESQKEEPWIQEKE